MATPRLPGYVPPATPPYVPPRQSLSRPTATAINRTAPREATLTITGQNEIIPVTYGEDRISGLWIVRPYTHIGSGELRFAMLWGWGPAEGVQDVYINGADVPGGVTMTHYTGEPGQGIDPTLGADIPGFGDVFAGCAYTVFRVPPATITGFPQQAQVEAVFRGRKLFDHRTGITAWSRNPGLAILDFVSDPRYGPAMPIRGIEAVADRCDSLVGGAEIRSQIGLTLSSGQYLDAWLDVLSTYAECLWSYDGDGILVVPDAPGDVVAVIDLDDVAENSFRFQGANLTSAPTIVTVTVRVPTGTPEQWREVPVVQELPGVISGEVPEIRSDVTMTGIHRPSEGNRKAITRLRRLQFPGSYAWQMFDRGVVFQRGDIVQLPDTRGLNSWLVRVLSIEMVELGIYQITAEHYDPSIYPDDVLPGDQTVVPVGAVLPFSGVEAPDGYELWDKADGQYLVGAGGSYAPGDTGGITSVVVSGTTAPGGGHAGTNDAVFWGIAGGSGSEDIQSPLDAPNHIHDYSSSAISHMSLWRRSRFVKKIGLPGQIPPQAGVFSNGQLISARLQEVSSNLGRLIRSQSDQDAGNGGNSHSRSINITTTSAGAHSHGTRNRAVSSRPSTATQSPRHEDAPNHRHSGNITVNFDPRRRRMALYMASDETDIIPGAVVGWDSSDPPPTGWYLCDGDNGTVDLVEYYIELSTYISAGEAVGDNTAWWDTRTVGGGAHNHQGEMMTGQFGNRSQRHAQQTPPHTHGVSGSAPYKPPYYALRFIQYTGVE